MSESLNQLQIRSHKGIYIADFISKPFDILQTVTSKDALIILDQNVAKIYSQELKDILNKVPHFIIEATEDNKDLSQFANYAKELVRLGAKRNVTLVAIGGGIIQDITCFLASTLFRGMKWVFFPTTLLAQADSCIGSKSSINVAGIKNLMGTFTPPNHIYIATSFLKTLKTEDLLSGIGEMIKVHGIGGIKTLSSMAQDYDYLIKDEKVFEKYLMNSLLIKKKLIEVDEFDTGPRLVMNYGHTFGHAIESATNYLIPHGIAVTLGQSMACEYSYEKGFLSKEIRDLSQVLLRKNFGNSQETKINFSKFLDSISKDKKNIGSKVMLILPKGEDFKIERHQVDSDDEFKTFCRRFFAENGFHVA